MQKWCPEPFVTDGASPVVAATAAAESYAPESLAPAEDGDRSGRVFRSEAGFKTPESLMDQLSQEERSLVFDLVEQDVSRNYEQRERELRAELQANQEAELARLREETRVWSAGYGVRHEEALREMAASCARLAVALAEKVIRGRVEQDPEVLVRAIETSLFAVGAGEALTVTVHPDDAAWLADRPDLRETLHIAEIVPDRRIDRGGCRISCEGREWDTTLTGQLGALSEVVAEWITTATAPCPAEDTP